MLHPDRKQCSLMFRVIVIVKSYCFMFLLMNTCNSQYAVYAFSSCSKGRCLELFQYVEEQCMQQREEKKHPVKSLF